MHENSVFFTPVKYTLLSHPRFLGLHDTLLCDLIHNHNITIGDLRSKNPTSLHNSDFEKIPIEIHWVKKYNLSYKNNFMHTFNLLVI